MGRPRQRQRQPGQPPIARTVQERDAHWQRKIAEKSTAALRAAIAETRALYRRMEAGEPVRDSPMFADSSELDVGEVSCDPPDGSPPSWVLAAMGNPNGQLNTRDEARLAIRWAGISSAAVRLEGALDLAEGLVAVCGAPQLIISPLVLCRPAVDAAVTVQFMFAPGGLDERLLRFYANHLNDATRQAQAVKSRMDMVESWPMRQSRQEYQRAWDTTRHMGELANFVIHEHRPRYRPTLFGPRPRAVEHRGASAPVELGITGAAHALNPVLGQAWSLGSGATHLAPWFVGSELQALANGHSRGAQLGVAIHSTLVSLGVLCDVIAGYTAFADPNFAQRNAERSAQVAPFFAAAIAEMPDMWPRIGAV